MSRCKYVAARENTARIDSIDSIVVSADDLNNVEMHKPALGSLVLHERQGYGSGILINSETQTELYFRYLDFSLLKKIRYYYYKLRYYYYKQSRQCGKRYPEELYFDKQL